VTVPRRRLILILFAMAIATITLAALFRPFKDTSGFDVPSHAEAIAAQAMFASALTPGAIKAQPQSYALGFSAATLTDDKDAIAFTETGGNCRGRGGYIIRTKNNAFPVAVTAPHRGSDLHTGTIVQALFAENNFAAAAWNSAPRRQTKNCQHGGDVARMPTHYFTSFALAFAKTHPGGRIIQLHGFDGTARRSGAARSADIIISDGSRLPSDKLLNLADCLSRNLPELNTAVFPYDSDELGATSNAQGRALRAAGFDGFTHIELNAGLRLKLVNDNALRARFAGCLSA
jgi:hypothetical protein